MKVILPLIFLLFIQFNVFAQSPFNYGQNKKVYFISTEQRSKMGIKNIYAIDQRQKGDLGGMWENWDAMVISFDTSSVYDDWVPMTLDSNYIFNIDSFINGYQSLNGTEWQFFGSKIIAYGGGGYGSFDFTQFKYFADTISIMATDCRGHCSGNDPVYYSKSVFNKKGQLLYTVKYPTPLVWNEDSVEIESDTLFSDSATLQDYDQYFGSNFKADNPPDTTFIHYSKEGLYINNPRLEYKDRSDLALKMFSDTSDRSSKEFHQCYVGRIKMEKFILNKLGYTPELILMEIYRQGVFVFQFNMSDKKYYRTGVKNLEDEG